MRARTMIEARALGLPRFFDGAECRNGHVAEKYSSQGICVVCQRDHARKWRQRNPYKSKAADAKKAWKKWNGDAEPSFQHITDEDIRDSFKNSGRRCAGCKERLSASEMTIDHVVPLSAGGRNSAENIQPMCFYCNMSKGAKTEKELQKNKSVSIYFDREKMKWRAQLYEGGKRSHIGYFQTRETAEEAAKTRS